MVKGMPADPEMVSMQLQGSRVSFVPAMAYCIFLCFILVIVQQLGISAANGLGYGNASKCRT